MATAPPSPFSFTLVGAGRVGTAVATLLRRAGNDAAGIASRSASSRERAARFLDAPSFDVAELPPADVVLVGVTEGVLEETTRAITGRVGPGTAVVHFAGSMGVAPLGAAIERGAWACALHPVQACPDVSTAIERLPGSAWGVTTTWPARGWAHRLVRDALGGVPVDVPEDARPVWHAAAVSTSNGIAALLAIGESLLAAIGIDSPHGVLGPLALGTVRNAIAGGGGGATLTGPAVRGELDTFARHLAALEEWAPELLPGYALSARVVVEAATRAGRIDDATARSVLASLDDDR